MATKVIIKANKKEIPAILNETVATKDFIKRPPITLTSYKSNAQIILRWQNQMGYIVIPGSKNVDHIRENFNINDFTLTDEEMKKIEALDTEKRYCVFTQEMFDGFAKMQPEYEK